MHGIYDYPLWYPALSPVSSFEDFQAHIHNIKPNECPKPCPASIVSTVGEACVSRAVSFDFFDAQLSQNNLGGVGPDSGSEEIRYKHVGNSSGRPFDLVVKAISKYQCNDRQRNGLSGKYGVINLKAGSKTDFRFSFKDSATGAPVVLEAFHFSVLDLDESP